jgi:hypothetical protein
LKVEVKTGMGSRGTHSARTITLLATVGALLTSTMVLVAGNQPAAAAVAPTRLRNAYSGVGSADFDAWGPWRGTPVTSTETWNDPRNAEGTTWGNMNGLWALKQWITGGGWTSARGSLSVAQPMFATGENVNTCAAQSNPQPTDQEISDWGSALKTAWGPSAYIRLGWEFNGDWYEWSMQPGDGPAFKRCWQRWYDVIKSVSTDFKLVFNPNFESKTYDWNNPDATTVNIDDFWPGAEYVDAAGPDNYARSENGALRDVNKPGPNGNPVGINVWVDWVLKKGVPFAVPEWGIWDTPGETWGSTDPNFMNQMRAAFEKAAASPSGLGYEDYFDAGSSQNCKHSIHHTDCPGAHAAAADRYRSLWSRPYTGSTCPCPPTPGANLALGRPATASSVEAAGLDAATATDGNAATRWSSTYADNQWITVDLGSSTNIDKVTLRWETASGKAYKIQTSNDNNTWADRVTVTAGTGGTATHTFAATSARYVRMLGQTRNTAYGFSLFELEVYATTPTNPSLSAPTNRADQRR